ncbi:hypothetical protein C7421_1089 [Pantoea ananatis]|nr:hypothetical protein C7421_1089 [Pantoea ananatis]
MPLKILLRSLTPRSRKIAEDQKKHDKELYEESTERASILLDFFKDQYDYGLERMRRIEDKALKLFGSVSVIITALVLTIRFVGGELLNSDADFFTVSLLIFGAGTFISLVISWVMVFSAVTLKDLPTLITDSDTATFFLTKPRNETLWDEAEQYHNALKDINNIHDKKAWRINISIHAMWLTAFFFVVFVVLLTCENLFKEGGMFNKSNKREDRTYQVTSTQLVQSNVRPGPASKVLTGSVTGEISLPNRSQGIKLGVALESYKSLSEQRAKAKA